MDDARRCRIKEGFTTAIAHLRKCRDVAATLFSVARLFVSRSQPVEYVFLDQCFINPALYKSSSVIALTRADRPDIIFSAIIGDPGARQIAQFPKLIYVLFYGS